MLPGPLQTDRQTEVNQAHAGQKVRIPEGRVRGPLPVKSCQTVSTHSLLAGLLIHLGPQLVVGVLDRQVHQEVTRKQEPAKEAAVAPHQPHRERRCTIKCARPPSPSLTGKSSSPPSSYEWPRNQHSRRPHPRARVGPDKATSWG